MTVQGARAEAPEVLVVSFRRADQLAECLDSVLRYLPESTVRVWDNLSAGSPEVRALALRRPEVSWHFHDENAGFAVAVNRLAEQVTAGSFLLLNPDAVLTGGLAGCIAALADPRVAAAGPSHTSHGRPHWHSAHREPTVLRQLTSYAGWSDRLARIAPLSTSYPRPPQEVGGYLTGSCLLVSTRAWRHVGGFDERYFLYGEEADWCRRARRAGYRLRFVAEDGVRHEAAGTVEDDPESGGRSRALLDQARQRYVRDHHGALAAALHAGGTRVLDRVQRSKRTAPAGSPAAGGAAVGEIVITTPTLQFGGAERQRVLLANALADAGARPVLTALQGLGPLEESLDHQVRREHRHPLRPRRSPSASVLVSGTTQIELVHGLLWRVRHPRGRWVVANHHPASAAAPAFGARLRWLMRRADGVIYLAHSHRELHRRHGELDGGRFWVIPNGVDPAAFQAPARERSQAAADPTPGGPVRLVCVGRLIAEKRADLLVRATALLPPDPPWTLDLWGDGPHRWEVESLAADSGGRVRVHGWTADVPGALAGAEVFALPSAFEAQPMVVLEAMAAGLCIVANDVATVPELLATDSAEPAGVLVSGQRPQDWAQALSRVIADPELRARLGARAAARVREHYSVTGMARRYLAMCQDVLAAGRR